MSLFTNTRTIVLCKEKNSLWNLIIFQIIRVMLRILVCCSNPWAIIKALWDYWISIFKRVGKILEWDKEISESLKSLFLSYKNCIWKEQ